MKYLHSLSISNLRNLVDVKLTSLSRFNLIYGANGAGKSSVLEAVYYLSLGRSFRSRQVQTVIGSSGDSLTVFGRLDDDSGAQTRVGVQRDDKFCRIKVDGQQLSSTSELAKLLPLVLLDSNSLQLILGGPARKREYMDWGLFHVEQKKFQALWSNYHKALKQRNELFRRGKIDRLVLSAWDAKFCEFGELLALERAAYIGKLKPYFLAISQLLGFVGADFNVELRRGWQSGLSLSNALQDSFERDCKSRTTSLGPHRANLAIRHNGIDVHDVLSRGQIKTLAIALQLANAMYVYQTTGKGVLVLIDDLAAEVDLLNRRLILDSLNRPGFQVIMTGIELDDMVRALPDGVAASVFHVEHGKIVKE